MGKSLAKNSIFKAILTICNTIIPVIVGPYILRVLSVDSYDLFNKYNADFQFFLVLGALGIYNYGIREVSKIRDNKEKCSKFFSEMFIIGVISHVIVASIYIFSILFFSTETDDKLLKFIFVIQFISGVFGFEWINEGNENYLFISIKSIIVRILYLVFIFLLVRNSNDVLIYALLVILSSVLNAVISFIYIKRKIPFTFKNLQFKKHIKPLLIIFVIANVSLLYTNLDKILLGNLVNSHAVSVYQIPHFISGLTYSLFISIVVVAIPRFAYLYANEGRESYFSLYKHITSMFFMFFIPCVFGMICLAREIVVLYGSETWIECTNPLILFAIAQLLGAFVYIFGDGILFVCGYEKKLVLYNAIGGIFNVLLDLILYAFNLLTPETSIITLMIAYLIASILSLRFAKKQIGFNVNVFNKSFILYFLTSLLFIPICYVISLYITNIILKCLLCILVCASIYLITLLLFKDKNLKGILNKFLPKK